MSDYARAAEFIGIYSTGFLRHSRDMIASLPILAVCLVISFVAGLTDISLGMGYGFTVTPILLLLGFGPRVAVPSVLFSSFVGALTSSFFHHRLGNVDFGLGGDSLRVSALIGGLGAVGGSVGALIALGISTFHLSLYIGSLVTASGLFVLASREFKPSFSWSKIVAMSLLGAFNKGLSGSGFGPIVTTGGLLSGLDEKASVSIQSLSESPVSLVGFLTFVLSGAVIEWALVFVLTIGVVLASPLAALVVQRLDKERLRTLIGLAAIAVGGTTLVRLFV
jgi:hypothetical protein